MDISLLNKAKKSDLITDPFPYLVIENALDDDLYEELSLSYPSDEHIMGDDEAALMRNNVRYQITARNAIRRKRKKRTAIPSRPSARLSNRNQ